MIWIRVLPGAKFKYSEKSPCWNIIHTQFHWNGHHTFEKIQSNFICYVLWLIDFLSSHVTNLIQLFFFLSGLLSLGSLLFV